MLVEFTHNDNHFDMHKQAVYGDMKLLMGYEGSGHRISKARICGYGTVIWEPQPITHYTGIGTEIREYKPWNFYTFHGFPRH